MIIWLDRAADPDDAAAAATENPTYDRRVQGERRLAESGRRHGKSSWDGEERRNTDRRQGERRGLQPGLIYSSTFAIMEILNWLEASCEGRWWLNCEGVDKKKSFRYRFEYDSDRRNFAAMLARFEASRGA